MADLHSKVDSSRQDEKNASKPIQQRPKLGYLRSAWTTSDLFYQSYLSATTIDDHHCDSGDDNIYHIRLPPLLLQDQEEEEDDNDEVLREIFRMITVANVLSLSGTLSSCTFIISLMPSWPQVVRHYKDWMPHAILPFYTLWWLFMILVLKNQRAEHLRQYLNWTQASAIIMACTNLLIPHYNLFFSALALLAAVIFGFAKRFLIASHLKHERLKQRLTLEHERLQQAVNDHTDEFANHRSAFLTTVSQEIQDVALMVITTLEQFSPASILSNTHELLSACSLAVPIASISAINTTIRQVCHVSSHLQLLSKLTAQGWNTDNALLPLPPLSLQEFDIGELLQNIGDALAGVASKLDVKLVIYHCDNNLHHKLVLGDEGAIRHALLNVSVRM
jgi:osomolarity two-component system response regulator SSK1